MSEKVVNVYEFQSENGGDSFIYSVKKAEDPLGFNYYILAKNETNEPVIYHAGNTVKTLQANGIHLTPIPKNTEKYKLFLKELLEALNNQKKERSLSRK